MTFTAITTKKDVREAYVALRDDLTKNAASAVVAVGWPGGHGKFTVHWHGKQGLWVLLQTNRLTNRYWCAYGTQSPRDHKYVNITCEINPPKSGRNGRCAGVFIRDSSGAVHIGHSGKVGGGGTGVGRTAFLDFYGKALKEITWPDGTTTSAIVIGKLSSPTLIAALAQFVYTVERFKDRAKRQEIGKLLEEDAARAEREGNFDPKNVKESRDKTIRQVNLRRGQPEFRRKLLRAYGGRCAVCGSDCTDTLEAAHILASFIEPFRWSSAFPGAASGKLFQALDGCRQHVPFGLQLRDDAVEVHVTPPSGAGQRTRAATASLGGSGSPARSTARLSS
jgi:hypothetical protein